MLACSRMRLPSKSAELWDMPFKCILKGERTTPPVFELCLSRFSCRPSRFCLHSRIPYDTCTESLGQAL